jgi:ubiquinone/menaquinone biosynthesis C-methylase UbiE
MLKYQKKDLNTGQKDVTSKEILKNIARDISKHILHIEIKDDMEIINQEFTRIESRTFKLPLRKTSFHSVSVFFSLPNCV